MMRNRCNAKPQPTSVWFVALALLFLAVTAGAQPAAPGGGEPARTPYDKLLDEESARAVARAQKAAGIAQAIGEDDLGLIDELFGFADMADPTARLKQIEHRRKVFRETKSNEHDIAGLDHLMAGRYADAEQAFGRSLAQDPGRGTATLFRGIAALEQGAWARSSAMFEQASGDKACQPLAGLLLAWAKRCVADPPASDAEAGLHLVKARAGIKMPKGNLATAMAGLMFFNECDALYWAQGVSYNLRWDKIQAALKQQPDPLRPHDSLARLVAFTSTGTLDEELSALAKQYPNDPLIAKHLALVTYQRMSNEELLEAWPQIQAWVDAQIKADPGNGLYYLMRVKPIYDFKDWVADDGEPMFEDISEPLSREEITALRLTLISLSIEHPGQAVMAEAARLRTQMLGGFGKPGLMPLIGIKHGWFRSIYRRYPNTFKQYVAAGDLKKAMELSKLLVAVSKKIAETDSDAHGMGRMMVRACESMLAWTWIEHAEETKDAALMRWAIDMLVHTDRDSRRVYGLLGIMGVMDFLPVTRMRTSVNALAKVEAGQAVSRSLYQFALRDGKPVEKRLENLKLKIEGSEDAWSVERSIIALAALREREAVPLLRELLANDELLIAELARWALLEFGEKVDERE